MADARFYNRAAPRNLADIAALCGASLLDAAHGDVVITDVASLTDAGDGQLSFLDNPKYKDQLTATHAAAVFVRDADAPKVPQGTAALVTPDPYRAYAVAAAAFYPFETPCAGVHPSAVVDAGASVDASAEIGPNAVIGAGASIGAGSRIGAGVIIGRGVQIGAGCDIGATCVLSHCLIGNGVRMLAGVKVGQDGFGFALSPKGHLPVPQLGRVVIGNGVTIGANTTIDRGAGPDTVIGDGTVIDNLVQIAHNVRIGRACVIVSQVGISGSTILDDFVILGGQVGVAGHLHLGAGARVAAQGGVSKDLAGRMDYAGSPCLPAREHWKQLAALKSLLSKRRVAE